MSAALRISNQSNISRLIWPHNSVSGGASAVVGSFADDRGTNANWLGAIRGGYGNPLKKLYTDRPVSEVVEQAFTDALQARKLLGDKQNAKVEITGEVIKFDCSYYFNREAHAHLLVKVLSLPSHTLIYSRAYQTDNKEGGWGAGIFGNTDELTQFAQRTLNETVDKVLAGSRIHRCAQRAIFWIAETKLRKRG